MWGVWRKGEGRMGNGGNGGMEYKIQCPLNENFIEV
jgi:hypothetical protein